MHFSCFCNAKYSKRNVFKADYQLFGSKYRYPISKYLKQVPVYVRIMVVKTGQDERLGYRLFFFVVIFWCLHALVGSLYSSRTIADKLTNLRQSKHSSDAPNSLHSTNVGSTRLRLSFVYNPKTAHCVQWHSPNWLANLRVRKVCETWFGEFFGSIHEPDDDGAKISSAQHSNGPYLVGRSIQSSAEWVRVVNLAQPEHFCYNFITAKR